MFIVIDIDFPERPNKTWLTKQEARDYIKCCAELCKRSVAGFRIYDTERHVTIKLVPKPKVVWEASCFNVVTHSYKKQLFKSREDGKNWCIMKGAGTLWSENITSGNLHQRLLDWDYSVRARGVQ